MLVEATVAIGVFVDRDPILATEVLGWWRRHAVVDGPQEFIAADHLQAGRIGILPEFDHPQAAARVPGKLQRLPDVGLGKDQFHVQVGGRLEPPQRLGGRQRPGFVGELLERAVDLRRGFPTREPRLGGRIGGIESGRPTIAVARSGLPGTGQPHRLGPDKQRRRGDIEACPAIRFLMNADRDGVQPSGPQHAGGNGEFFRIA